MDTSRSSDSTNHTYTMGYSEEFQALLRRRSAAQNAAHLLPLLRPGMRVLDFGCGPGTISLGLAKAVEPGELIGIDIEESQVEMARKAARDGGHRNACFQAGNAAHLPFEDHSFDVAHCHAVLMHVRDNMTVLEEMMRVLKPGGLIASREMIGSASLLEPETESLGSAWQAFTRLIEANGGHPDMGKELKRVLLDSGFENVRATASFECYSDDDDVKFYRNLALGWFCAPSTVEAAKGAGLATQEQFDLWRRDLDAWGSHPGAFAAIAWGEAVGRKPAGAAL